MDRSTVILTLIGGVIIVILWSTTIGLQAFGMVWVAKRIDLSTLTLNRYENYIDEQIDAGFWDVQRLTDDPLLDQRSIVLAYNINSRAAKEIAAKLLYLNSIDQEKPINLYISTQGGYGDSAFTIIDAIRLIDAPVNTWAFGGCYSSGALVLAAGTGTRRITENTILMVHTNLDDSSAKFTFDRLARDRYERFWREAARLPRDWFPMTTGHAYYLSPEEALTFKIVDEIVPSATHTEDPVSAETSDSE
ncbi:MAG TPA: ATP-dependent Clp protease proteolytic subunit [bacterium]|nr:ATP-dependent Clp protease proteolytic subunit [bacterium]